MTKYSAIGQVQQEIAQVADAAVRKYEEGILVEDRSEAGVANSMRVGAKEKNSKLYVKMIKLLTVANPAHGPGFLEEVSLYTNT